MAEHRWHDLHWLTWLALMAMLGSLVWLQLYGPAPSSRYNFGWPLPVLNVHSDGWWVPRGFLLPSLVDLIVLAGALASTTFVVEKSRRNAWQLRVTSLFWLTAIIGLLFAARMHIEGSPVRALSDYPVPVDISLSVALGCTIYIAGWLAGRLIGCLHDAASASRR